MVLRKTIYLADDDADDRLLLVEAIMSIDPNIEIVEAESGQQLLAVLQSQTLPERSLIILDMNMPLMNGLETLANLHTFPGLALLPTVILSTSGNAEMIKRAKQLGAMNYYIKPFNIEGLMRLSQQLISENL